MANANAAEAEAKPPSQGLHRIMERLEEAASVDAECLRASLCRDCKDIVDQAAAIYQVTGSRDRFVWPNRSYSRLARRAKKNSMYRKPLQLMGDRLARQDQPDCHPYKPLDHFLVEDSQRGPSCALCILLALQNRVSDPSPTFWKQSFAFESFDRHHDGFYARSLLLNPHMSAPGLVLTRGDLKKYLSIGMGTSGLGTNRARMVRPMINVDIIHDWLDACRSAHDDTCRARSPSENIPGLRFIDCATRALVAAPPGAKYLALSYVWGKQAGGATSESNTRSLQRGHLPATIEDAIQVTRMLCFRYLWVDKYCIDQGRPDEKHQQIANMDLIYNGSELTLVAAAGVDQSAGLPGVTSSRTPKGCGQVSITDTGINLVYPPSRGPELGVRNSRWMTRGWTFQEAVLSRRLLSFTDQGLYFECGMTHFDEWFDLPLNFVEVQHGVGRPIHDGIPVLTPSIFSGLHGGSTILAAGPSKTMSTLGVWASMYSKRSLTFESDTLFAFSGIMRSMRRNSLWHVAGVPYMDVSPSGPTSTRRTRRLEDSFVQGLRWGSGSDRSLTYAIFERKRRSGFPSWSWAGWTGPVAFDPCQPAATTQSLSFDLGGGQVVDLNAYHADHAGDSLPYPVRTLLILKAHGLDGDSLAYYDMYNFRYDKFTLGLRGAVKGPGSELEAKVFIDRVSSGDLQLVVISKSLLVGARDSFDTKTSFGGLVLATMGGDKGLWERVGEFSLEDHSEYFQAESTPQQRMQQGVKMQQEQERLERLVLQEKYVKKFCIQ
ncbi:hypothetical protein MKZ38_004213 [Zalerion maritima]|uniref:Heterokaryon incompatibility domain-containing protein n=1 Tax=Zalerion maritima TaxID=339359 RepID=A0AAD5RML5_9PEZI|nr:hypothetical protein MKZ38_004213 [Zalerion maritima]